MTEISETTTETTEVEDVEESGPATFLRIRASYPIAADRFADITLELNPRDDETLDGGSVEFACWLTDFSRQVVASMQEAVVPPYRVIGLQPAPPGPDDPLRHRPVGLPGDRNSWAFGDAETGGQ
jgi:hypothetical protein